MSERVKDEHQTPRVAPMAGSAGEMHRVDSFGIGVRIDPAHSFSSSGTEARQVEWQNLQHFVPNPGTKAPAAPAVSSRPIQSEDDIELLDDWGQRARRLQEQIRIQRAELEQREQILRRQLIDLEQQQQQFSQHSSRDQAQMEARRSKVQQEESSLAERTIAFELQVRKYEAGLAAFQSQRADLERRKSQLRDEVLQELRAERKDVDQAKQALQQDLEHAQILKQALEQRLDSLAADNVQVLKSEREKLWQSLTSEWEQRQAQFLAERENWLRARDVERSELDREKAVFEAAMEQANADFVIRRQELQNELEEYRQQQISAIDQERQKWEAVRQSEEELLAKRFDEQQIAQFARQTQHNTELEQQAIQFRAELTAEREQWEDFKQRQLETIHLEQSELARQREWALREVEAMNQRHAALLAAEQEEWSRTRAEQEALLRAEQERWDAYQQNAEQQLSLAFEQHQKEISADRDLHLTQIAVELEQHQSRIISEQQDHQSRIFAEQEQHQNQLAAERQQHESQIAAELDQHQNLIRSELEQHQSRIQTELEQHQAQITLEAEQHAHWLITEREQVISEVQALREQCAAEITEQRQAWTEERDREQTLLEEQKAEWLISRDAMLVSSREALEREFIAQREEQSRLLQAERDEWEVTLRSEKTVLETQQAEFIRERALIENRIRFQQDHLDKSRVEFEQSQNEARRERQVELQRMEEINMATIRRLKQIDLYRDSIDAREKSLDREQEVFNRTRKAVSSTADFDRLNLQAERHAWEQEKQIQQKEMMRQQEALLAKTESVESRRVRLDKLRAELEETHRATLEMRLAVEESWAQLTQVAGQDDARQRVDQVRESLAGYYQQMHESVSEQRKELIESQTKLERTRAEFTEERQKLMNWITGRDQELRVSEERLRQASNDAAANHTKWLTARDKWLMEKTEAEKLIRRLLASLGENNRDQSTHQSDLSRLDEIQIPIESLLPGKM